MLEIKDGKLMKDGKEVMLLQAYDGGSAAKKMLIADSTCCIHFLVSSELPLEHYQCLAYKEVVKPLVADIMKDRQRFHEDFIAHEMGREDDWKRLERILEDEEQMYKDLKSLSWLYFICYQNAEHLPNLKINCVEPSQIPEEDLSHVELHALSASDIPEKMNEFFENCYD